MNRKACARICSHCGGSKRCDSAANEREWNTEVQKIRVHSRLFAAKRFLFVSIRGQIRSATCYHAPAEVPCIVRPADSCCSSLSLRLPFPLALNRRQSRRSTNRAARPHLSSALPCTSD